ncbi:MAG: hypothetical protein J2P17_24265, partial [Mycobacterium sp.]|nr:hypothetical protein [Mycobacterium sp.]
APPESAELKAASQSVVAYFAATAPLWNSRSDATRPSRAQAALAHAAGTDQAIKVTNQFVATIKATMTDAGMQIIKTTVTTEIVKTSVVGPHHITTISNVSTDWTASDQSDASATVGHQTTTIATLAGPAVVSDVVLPDS